MVKKIKMFFASLAAASALVLPVAVPATVSAQTITEGLDKGSCLNVEATGCDATLGDPEDRLNTIITRVINIFSIIVGIISVIMIIIGGLKYITSAGESSNVTAAKNTILYAIIGLVVVALAQFVVRYVLNQVRQ